MDISHHAGSVVDAVVAKANGLFFAIVKAKNSIFTSNWFVKNWKSFKDAGIPRGAYFWLYPYYVMSVTRQADELYSLLSGQSGELESADFGELPVTVDFEWTKNNGIDTNPDASDLKTFVLRWEEISGKKPMIYTAKGYWDEYGTNHSFWADYKLWIANYDVLVPNIPAPWALSNKSYTFWQFTDSGFGEDYGVNPLYKKKVDLNYYNGTKEEFNKEFLSENNDTPDEPEVPDEQESISGVVIVTPFLNVRSGNSIFSTTVGKLEYGDKVSGYIADESDGYKWLQIASPEVFSGAFCAISSRFVSYIETTVLEQTEEHKVLRSGVQYHRVFRFDSWCNVVIVDPNKNNFLVTKFNGLKTVSEVAVETNADIVLNGGDFNYYGAVGFAMSEGVKFGNRQDTQPFINFSKENVIKILPYTDERYAYNAVAGKRLLVVNGKQSTSISNSWYDKHPRTLAGVTIDGKFIGITVDGRQPDSVGVDLFESAKIMLEFGADKALDLDGGGSTAQFIKELGGIVNVPIDEYIIGKERPVGDCIVIYSKLDNNEEPIPDEPIPDEPIPDEPDDDGGEMPDGTKYACNVVRATRVRPQPSVWFNYTDTLLVDHKFVAVKMLHIPKSIANQVEDGIWLELETGGWTAAQYKGEKFVEYYAIQGDTEPSTPVTPVLGRIELDDGTVWESTNWIKV